MRRLYQGKYVKSYHELLDEDILDEVIDKDFTFILEIGYDNEDTFDLNNNYFS